MIIKILVIFTSRQKNPFLWSDLVIAEFDGRKKSTIAPARSKNGPGIDVKFEQSSILFAKQKKKNKSNSQNIEINGHKFCWP